MIAFFKNPLPRLPYLRLLEHQKKMKLDSYEPDFPLMLFVFFSRVAAALSLVSVFFPESMQWVLVSLGCMVLAILASIAHLSVPSRFLTMIINNRSYLAWEIRLAGALTTFLGLQFVSWFGWFHEYRPYFPWVNFGLSFFFLISTGWAYRFQAHPAWKSSTLPLYYLTSAFTIGLGLRSVQYPHPTTPFLFATLVVTKAFVLILYRNHLKKTSPTSLRKIVVDKKRWVFLAFLWTDLLFPALLACALFVDGEMVILYCLLSTSCLMGILLERILFFWVETPVFFLSLIGNPEVSSKYPYWIRG